MNNRITACLAVLTMVISLSGCHTHNFGKSNDLTACEGCGIARCKVDDNHSVTMGICAYCGEVQNYDALVSLNNAIKEASIYNEYARDYAGEYKFDSVNSSISKAQDIMEDAKQYARLANDDFLEKYYKVLGFDVYKYDHNSKYLSEQLDWILTITDYQTAFDELVSEMDKIKSGVNID